MARSKNRNARRFPVVRVATCALLSIAVIQTAAASCIQGQGQDTDSDVKQDAPPLVDPEHVKSALAALNESSEGTWRAALDKATGLPRTLQGGKSIVYSGTPKAIAEQFLEDNAALFGLDMEHMTIRHDRTTEHKTGHRIEMSQQYRSLPIAHSKATLLVTTDGRVMFANSTFWPVEDVAVAPGINASAAQRKVEKDLAPEMSKPVGGEWQKPQLAVYPKGHGQLAWLVHRRIGEEEPLPWEFALDANTGELLEFRDVIKEHAHSKPPKQEPQTNSRPSNVRAQAAAHASRLAGGAPDPCDRMWFTLADCTVTESGAAPTDQYFVDIALAPGSAGQPEDGTQPEAVNGAGIQLLPCIEYTINFSWDISTWDSYNFDNGYWDVFVVHINSVGFYWDIVFPPGISEQGCDSMYDPDGLIDLPGPLWTAGGFDWGDEFLCTNSGSFSFTYEETDPTKTVYLSVALDTLVTGSVDGLYPSWGNVTLEIVGETKAFDPNPVTALNNGGLTDMGDINGAVPCPAYIDVDPLPNLDTPAAGQPYKLTGDYCTIVDKPTALAYMPPESRDGIFPYIRDCQHFEAVNCYYAISANQDYIQALGFNTINNRQIEVDPHGIADDNSFYFPNVAGTGYLVFGDGGVDDGEDADVIIHEYGHSIQDNTNPGAFSGSTNNGFGDETGALGEAFGDYWACSTYFPQNTSSGFNPALFANWDAVPGGLRNLANAKTYPASMVNAIHTDGEIWSGSLWDLSKQIGLITTDILALDANFWVPNNPDFVDNADALLFSDFLHNTSANEDAIVNVMTNRGIYRKVKIESSPSGAAIDVSDFDKKDDADGVATFERFYGHGDSVTLTAPAVHGGEPFRRWKLDGVPQAIGVDALAVTFSEVPNVAHNAEAIFGTLPGDTNGDDIVNVTDLLTLLGGWGACPPPCPPSCAADFNGDCVVNVTDLLTLLGGWG